MNHFPWEVNKSIHIIALVSQKGNRSASSKGEFYLATKTSSPAEKLHLASYFSNEMAIQKARKMCSDS